MTDVSHRPVQPEAPVAPQTPEVTVVPDSVPPIDVSSNPSARTADRKPGFSRKALAAGTAVLALTAGAIYLGLRGGGGETVSTENTEQIDDQTGVENDHGQSTPEAATELPSIFEGIDHADGSTSYASVHLDDGHTLNYGPDNAVWLFQDVMHYTNATFQNL